MSQKLELGQRVLMTGKAEKVRDRVSCPRKMEWDLVKDLPGYVEYGMLRTRMVGFPLEQPLQGVIVGKRTLQQGLTEASSFAEPARFFALSTIEVWLVSFRLRRKPIMCFDAQLGPITEMRFCIDADCPSCGFPERSLVRDVALVNGEMIPGDGKYGCNKCNYTSQERNR